MTPKEKAKELMILFYPHCNGADNSGRYYQDLADDNAKECVIIMIDEILKTLKTCWDEKGSFEQHGYWEQVKKELESF